MATIRDSLQRVLGTAFVIERELTGGGMAHLYVALDTALDRRVVVKVLPPERSEGVSLERFRGEIRTVAALQHPNIVGILSAGEVEGLPYYMMPFIDGESLRALLEREGSLGSRATVAILRDVARACAYAHERGIMHRDIKPDNVLLAGGAAMITDFGVAKALSAAQRPSKSGDTLTREGFTVGTPMYMAPEQLAGDPSMDSRADFYAIGVMAYEMLSGQVPFAHPTPRALLAAQLSEAPRPLRELKPAIPARLAKLVTACLQKDPDDRPASASAILAALDDPALLSDEFATGRRSSSTATVPVPARRRWLRIGILSGAILAAAAGAILMATRSGSPADAGSASGASIAVLPFQDQSPDSSGAYLADGLTDAITTMLGSVANLRVASRTGADRYRDQRPPAADIGRELNVTALLDGSVVRSGEEATTTVTLVDAATGRVMLSRSMTAPVKELVRVQESLANDAVSALTKRFGRLSTSALKSREGFRNAEAYDLYLRGVHAFRRRGSSLQEALQRFQEAAALDSTAAQLYASLADVFAVMPLYSSMAPQVALEKALPYAERAVALDSTSAASRASRGYVFDLLWRWDEGAADLRRAVALDSEFALARQWYGENLLLNGDVEGAVRELGAAARLEPYSAVVAGLHGMATVLLGRVDSGLSMARRAVDLEPGQAAPRLLLGAAYIYAGRPFDAVFTLAGAQELDPANPQVLGMLGYSYAVLGQTAKARAILTRLTRDHDHPGTVSALARIRIGMGNPDEALTLLEQAAKNHDPLFASEPLLTPIFDPLRQHPRFERLVQQIGLSRRVLGGMR